MIDIDRLRQLAQATNEHSDDRAEILAEFYAATQSDIIIELLDRLEASEKSDAESLTLYRKARDERDALRAKIAEMEKQEPVAEWVDGAFDQYPHLRWREPYKAIVGAKLYTKLYALPGAKGE